MKYYMFNKPAGCVTARTDGLHRTVMDYFPEDMRDTFHPCGRLDIDTTGLIIITDDGKFTHRIMRPEMHVSKTYFFYAIGTLTEEKIKMIENGVCVKGIDNPLMPAHICSDFTGKITEIEEFLPEKKREKLMKTPRQDVFSGYITIKEGKNHQVKRMMRAIDCCIVYLERVAIGNVSLDISLKRGEYRELTAEEKKKIEEAAV